MENIQSYRGLSYMHFPMSIDDLEPGIKSPDNPMIEFENEMAGLAFEMALLFIGCRLRRTLWYCRGWPWRFCLLGAEVDASVQAATAASLRSDLDNFKLLIQFFAGENSAMARRSCFNTVAVQQLVQIMESCHWRPCQKVQAWADSVHEVILTTQIVEDGFQRLRGAERKGINKKVHARRSFSTLITKQVLGKVHHYSDLKYESQQIPRNTQLPMDAYKAKQNDASLELTKIIGPGTRAA
eukprot:4184823-Lingulodinium_polyedra.AAC.1